MTPEIVIPATNVQFVLPVPSTFVPFEASIAVPEPVALESFTFVYETLRVPAAVSNHAEPPDEERI